MYKIGEFSRISNVSIRMLRHYDKMDLLKPLEIDIESGYRIYSIEQLPKLNRIIFLKNLGFSLIEVKELIDKNLSLDDMKNLYFEKQKKIQEEIELANQKLKMLSLRLEQIEEEGKSPKYDIDVKKSDKFTIASIRHIIPHISDMKSQCKLMYQNLYEELRKNKINFTGPEISFYHNEEYVENDLEVEVSVCIPKEELSKKIDSKSNLKLKIIEEENVGTLVYKGLYKDLESGVFSLLNWIGINNYNIKGAFREIRHSKISYEKTEFEEVILELQIPLKK